MRHVGIAVQGAGQIGRRHVEHILATKDAMLAAIIDPAPAARELAATCGVPWFDTFQAMCAAGITPVGLVVATPSQLHVSHGLAAIEQGIPVLVEKPISTDAASARTLVDAAEAANVPLLVGHHRRHNPLIQRAKSIVESGRLGRLVSVHSYYWIFKPDDYFDIQWRRERGAGPILTNLIHDIDLLRYLCGEITLVQAMTSNAVRGHAVEETAVVTLKFANGALGTANVTDSAVAPWSWEQTTGENPAYPRTDQFCYTVGGTHGSLAIPRLEVWSNTGKRSWFEPMTSERTIAPDQDPLPLQIAHFCRVIRREEQPLVSGREGLKTLKVIEAIHKAAATGTTIEISTS
jgi:predicted dehydrogenase